MQPSTHFSPCSTRGTAQLPHPCHHCWHRCIPPDYTSHKWNQNIPGPNKQVAEKHFQFKYTLHIPDRKQQKGNLSQHTPLRQTCVSEWQEVKFFFGSEAGHRAVPPLHMPSLAHSDSNLHFSFVPLKVHSGVQHGPWLGLQNRNYRSKVKQQAILTAIFGAQSFFTNYRTVQRKSCSSHLTCRFYQVGVCTFCPPLHWRCSSRGLCTDHCNRSHTLLQLPLVHYHI